MDTSPSVSPLDNISIVSTLNALKSKKPNSTITSTTNGSTTLTTSAIANHMYPSNSSFLEDASTIATTSITTNTTAANSVFGMPSISLFKRDKSIISPAKKHSYNHQQVQSPHPEQNTAPPPQSITPLPSSRSPNSKKIIFDLRQSENFSYSPTLRPQQYPSSHRSPSSLLPQLPESKSTSVHLDASFDRISNPSIAISTTTAANSSSSNHQINSKQIQNDDTTDMNLNTNDSIILSSRYHNRKSPRMLAKFEQNIKHHQLSPSPKLQKEISAKTHEQKINQKQSQQEQQLSLNEQLFHQENNNHNNHSSIAQSPPTTHYDNLPTVESPQQNSQQKGDSLRFFSMLHAGMLSKRVDGSERRRGNNQSVRATKLPNEILRQKFNSNLTDHTQKIYLAIVTDVKPFILELRQRHLVLQNSINIIQSTQEPIELNSTAIPNQEQPQNQQYQQIKLHRKIDVNMMLASVKVKSIRIPDNHKLLHPSPRKDDFILNTSSHPNNKNNFNNGTSSNQLQVITCENFFNTFAAISSFVTEEITKSPRLERRQIIEDGRVSLKVYQTRVHAFTYFYDSLLQRMHSVNEFPLRLKNDNDANMLIVTNEPIEAVYSSILEAEEAERQNIQLLQKHKRRRQSHEQNTRVSASNATTGEIRNASLSFQKSEKHPNNTNIIQAYDIPDQSILIMNTKNYKQNIQPYYKQQTTIYEDESAERTNLSTEGQQNYQQFMEFSSHENGVLNDDDYFRNNSKINSGLFASILDLQPEDQSRITMDIAASEYTSRKLSNHRLNQPNDESQRGSGSVIRGDSVMNSERKRKEYLDSPVGDVARFHEFNRDFNLSPRRSQGISSQQLRTTLASPVKNNNHTQHASPILPQMKQITIEFFSSNNNRSRNNSHNQTINFNNNLNQSEELPTTDTSTRGYSHYATPVLSLKQEDSRSKSPAKQQQQQPTMTLRSERIQSLNPTLSSRNRNAQVVYPFKPKWIKAKKSNFGGVGVAESPRNSTNNYNNSMQLVLPQLDDNFGSLEVSQNNAHLSLCPHDFKARQGQRKEEHSSLKKQPSNSQIVAVVSPTLRIPRILPPTGRQIGINWVFNEKAAAKYKEIFFEKYGIASQQSSEDRMQLVNRLFREDTDNYYLEDELECLLARFLFLAKLSSISASGSTSESTAAEPIAIGSLADNTQLNNQTNTQLIDQHNLQQLQKQQRRSFKEKIFYNDDEEEVFGDIENKSDWIEKIFERITNKIEIPFNEVVEYYSMYLSKLKQIRLLDILHLYVIQRSPPSQQPHINIINAVISPAKQTNNQSEGGNTSRVSWKEYVRFHAHLIDGRWSRQDKWSFVQFMLNPHLRETVSVVDFNHIFKDFMPIGEYVGNIKLFKEYILNPSTLIYGEIPFSRITHSLLKQEFFSIDDLVVFMIPHQKTKH